MVFATVARGIDVDVTANRSDEEPGRLVRLERVLGFVHALAAHYGNAELLAKVSSVHDHKGDLTVRWNAQPATGEMELFNRAWSDDTIGDAWGPVEHVNEKGQTISSWKGPGHSYSGTLVPVTFHS